MIFNFLTVYHNFTKAKEIIGEIDLKPKRRPLTQ